MDTNNNFYINNNDLDIDDDDNNHNNSILNSSSNNHNRNIESDSIEESNTTPQHKSFLKLHRLNQGVSYKNIVGSYIASFLTQPIILTNSLNIPDDKQVVLCTSHFWGLLSDKVGRRIVYVLSMLIMSVGLGIYPFANHIYVLMIFRAVFAVGAAAASSMLSAVLADYVLFDDRGKASGLLGLCAGGGAVLGSLVLLKIPNLIDQHSSVGITMSAQLTYCLTAGLALAGAIYLWFSLQRRDEAKIHQEHSSVLKIAKEGLIAGKNPVLSLSYLSGFLARGDSALATTFLSLWIYQYSLAHNGGNKTDALSKSGTITGIAQTFGLFFAPVAGFLCDKMNRLLATVTIALLGCLGYFLIAFSSDPLSMTFIVSTCIIGCAETGMVVSSTALVAQEAPKECRGSVGGFFSFCGAIDLDIICFVTLVYTSLF
ncbi:hypothetical protein PPL_09641 [Heterostelium album PN500]|uniref:Major facilitator superfamily (MFS) profile domain-containing protein n=1 Tax=Heterostelium pallidum (strain ATCC 26659 / Pp 5 / PN500) TaxID=670386 RepID=D3BNX0_HETP5|nr:hypothetical protein PPL_09641 [Heterostelium album PN500]EFA76889.1 hypothetical protein PPL_09641 [Heterostelium album PN500]|eukprot:XP_020429021.1 hypothetical protein PPL_09641 [Heterostelium album PN500]